MNLLKILLSPFFIKMNQNIPQDCILIDVRSPSEFATGHIEGSINLPLGWDLSSMEKNCPNTDANILVFCASGMRSSTFKSILQQKGYRNVFNGGGVSTVALTLNKPIVR